MKPTELNDDNILFEKMINLYNDPNAFSNLEYNEKRFFEFKKRQFADKVINKSLNPFLTELLEKARVDFYEMNLTKSLGFCFICNKRFYFSPDTSIKSYNFVESFDYIEIRTITKTLFKNDTPKSKSKFIHINCFNKKMKEVGD